MFIVLTNSNCVSCEKIIDFLESEGEMYKEYNVGHTSLSEENLKLLLSTKGRSLLNFVREKATYFTDNNIVPKTLNEEELSRLIKFNLKEVGSFPIILQLNYSGRVKNCMIGFDEDILKKWINHQEIFNCLININKAFGTDECCWLCKKQKVLDKIKSTATPTHKKSNNDKIINNLMNLKKKNDSLVGKDTETKKTEETYIPDNEWLKDKYSKAREEILDNDEKMKDSYDFFSMNNKNQSFIEQLEDEKEEAINNSIFIDTKAQEVNEEPKTNLVEQDDIIEPTNKVEEIHNIELEPQAIDSPVIEKTNEDIKIVEPVLLHDETNEEDQDNDFIHPTSIIEEQDEEIKVQEPIIEFDKSNDNSSKEQDYRFIETSEYVEEINIHPDLDEPIVFRKTENGFVSNEENNEPNAQYPIKEDLVATKAIYTETITGEPEHLYRVENEEEIPQVEIIKDEGDDIIMPIHKLAPDDEVKDNSNADYFIPNNNNNNIDGTVHEEVIENKDDEEEIFFNVDLTDASNPVNEIYKTNMNSKDILDQGNKNPNLNDLSSLSEQNAHLKTNAVVIDEYDEWIKKYRLSEQEINHQKAIENDK